MKSISITGKNNIDKIIHNKDNNKDNFSKRNNVNYQEPSYIEQL